MACAYFLSHSSFGFFDRLSLGRYFLFLRRIPTAPEEIPWLIPSSSGIGFSFNKFARKTIFLAMVRAIEMVGFSGNLFLSASSDLIPQLRFSFFEQLPVQFIHPLDHSLNK